MKTTTTASSCILLLTTTSFFLLAFMDVSHGFMVAPPFHVTPPIMASSKNPTADGAGAEQCSLIPYSRVSPLYALLTLTPGDKNSEGGNDSTTTGANSVVFDPTLGGGGSTKKQNNLFLFAGAARPVADAPRPLPRAGGGIVTINVGRDISGPGADQPIVSRDVIDVPDFVGEVVVNVFEADSVPDVTVNIAPRFQIQEDEIDALEKEISDNQNFVEEELGAVVDVLEGKIDANSEAISRIEGALSSGNEEEEEKGM